jgi:folate-binding protein YgfZ
MDDTTIAQEANLETLGAMSFTKGCYTGQEVVARIHFRGHVNRRLRGLKLADGPFPASRTDLLDETGAAVGELRSMVRSPRFGAIALGMVRREIADGVKLRTSSNDVGTSATLVPLPFTRE